jgi:hypothetical protein
MIAHDIDQDGREDLVVLVPYEKIKLLLQRDEGGFEDVDAAAPGGSVDQPWVMRADVDGDGKLELLLAQKNFVRAVVLARVEASAVEVGAAAWRFVVKDQINGATQNSRILGAAALTEAGQDVPRLYLLDGDQKALSVCRRDEAGVWQIIRNRPLPFTEFTSLQSVAFGSEDPNAIAFMGLNAVAWMTFGGPGWELAELDGYETPIKDGKLMDVVSGDLNRDGRQDLVFMEAAKNHLDLVRFSPESKLIPATRWKVFEERSFRGRGMADQGEPREALIKDLTGDGLNDLAVLVHDRVLVYPQQ